MKVFRTHATRRIAVATAAIAAGLAISGTAYAATSSSTAAASVIPRCTASDLGVWIAVDQGNGAAGTIYYPLQFTNLSGHTCYLYGYPGVSVISSYGQQLGSPASWGSLNGAHVVNLVPGATAHTILAYHDVAVTTEAGCDPVYTADALSVIPPDQRTAAGAAYSFESCSRPGPIYLSVIEPIIPGPGTIYG